MCCTCGVLFVSTHSSHGCRPCKQYRPSKAVGCCKQTGHQTVAALPEHTLPPAVTSSLLNNSACCVSALLPVMHSLRCSLQPPTSLARRLMSISSSAPTTMAASSSGSAPYQPQHRVTAQSCKGMHSPVGNIEYGGRLQAPMGLITK